MGGWALRADRQALQVLCLFASRLVPKEVEATKFRRTEASPKIVSYRCSKAVQRATWVLKPWQVIFKRQQRSL